MPDQHSRDGKPGFMLPSDNG